jgi:NAD(P)H-dependent FMN reductase
MSIAASPSIDGIPIYNADIQNSSGFPALVNALADAIRAADALIFVSPEYNYTIPGGLKNAIDWVSRLQNQPFAGKPIALQSASGGPLGGSRMQYHLRQSMVFLDGLVFTRPEIFVGMASSSNNSPDSKSSFAVSAERTEIRNIDFAAANARTRGRRESEYSWLRYSIPSSFAEACGEALTTPPLRAPYLAWRRLD